MVVLGEHICRKCSRFNPGQWQCRWCGVPYPKRRELNERPMDKSERYLFLMYAASPGHPAAKAAIAEVEA